MDIGDNKDDRYKSADENINKPRQKRDGNMIDTHQLYSLQLETYEFTFVDCLHMNCDPHSNFDHA